MNDLATFQLNVVLSSPVCYFPLTDQYLISVTPLLVAAAIQGQSDSSMQA